MSNLQTLTIQRDELLAKIREIESSCEGIENEHNAQRVQHLTLNTHSFQHRNRNFPQSFLLWKVSFLQLTQKLQNFQVQVLTGYWRLLKISVGISLRIKLKVYVYGKKWYNGRY